MDKVKVFFSYLSAPLERIADIVAKYPKGVILAWTISIVVIAWIF